LPAELEDHVIHHVHTLLVHLETEKSVFHISQTFHLKNLSRTVRKLISRCSVCRMVKHPTRRFETECRHHIPKAVGEICVLDYMDYRLAGAEASIIFCLLGRIHEDF